MLNRWRQEGVEVGFGDYSGVRSRGVLPGPVLYKPRLCATKVSCPWLTSSGLEQSCLMGTQGTPAPF